MAMTTVPQVLPTVRVVGGGAMVVGATGATVLAAAGVGCGGGGAGWVSTVPVAGGSGGVGVAVVSTGTLSIEGEVVSGSTEKDETGSAGESGDSGAGTSSTVVTLMVKVDSLTWLADGWQCRRRPPVSARNGCIDGEDPRTSSGE